MADARVSMKNKVRILHYVRLVDLAAQLDVTPQHLCNLVRRGVLPAIRVGAVIRVPIAAARKLLSVSGGKWATATPKQHPHTADSARIGTLQCLPGEQTETRQLTTIVNVICLYQSGTGGTHFGVGWRQI